MTIKSYSFKNSQNKVFKKIKRLMVKKNTRILLFAISGALLLAAICIFAIQWNEGVTAGEEAQELLGRSGINPAPSEGIPFPVGNGVYVQPEAPEPIKAAGRAACSQGS